ncbi:hypothetical protein [Salibacterium lacus]|uniref:Uncharacterized protein n=1 Tax=Salibacterium lacus TaxID=1898109 RepID=A0ABW5T009_9BACI
MAKDWLLHPWLERFLPDRMRPVDDHIFSDAHGLVIVQETEGALDRLIEYGRQIKSSQNFKKNGDTFHFRLKVNQKRMKLLSYENHKSKAAIKKRIVIEYFRKSYLPKNRQKRCKEATVQYIKNGQTFVRSIQQSTYFQGIFDKLEQLDDALLGDLIQNQSPAAGAAEHKDGEPSGEKDFIHSGEEPFHQLMELEKKKTESWQELPALINNRLSSLMEEIRRTGDLFDTLDVEDRYTIKRMLTKDIPSLVDTFLSLSSDNRGKQTEQLYEALVKMEVNVGKLREKTEHTKVEQMEQLIELNERRYPVQRKNNPSE